MKTGNDSRLDLEDSLFGPYKRCGWRPNADIYRSAEGWLVKLELAGVAERDIRIIARTDYIVIEGKRGDWCVRNTQESLSMEITYDRFTRIVQLPGAIETGSLQTEYRDGMLLVYLRSKR